MTVVAPAAVSAAVLIVEDQPLLLLDAVDLVEAEGLRAIGVGHADAALAILTDDPGIGILLTGIDMAGSVDGLALAALVRERWPAVRVIVTSGHLPPALDDLPGVRFLPRPYDTATLREALGELVA